MSDDAQLKTHTPTGYKNAAARTLPGTDQIAAAILNTAANLVPVIYKDLYETLMELGQHDRKYLKEADAVKLVSKAIGT